MHTIKFALTSFHVFCFLILLSHRNSRLAQLFRLVLWAIYSCNICLLLLLCLSGMSVSLTSVAMLGIWLCVRECMGEGVYELCAHINNLTLGALMLCAWFTPPIRWKFHFLLSNNSGSSSSSRHCRRHCSSPFYLLHIFPADSICLINFQAIKMAFTRFASLNLQIRLNEYISI